MCSSVKGVNQARPQSGMAERRISLPPPSPDEQRRIVAKVKELVGLRDTLEAQLATSETKSSQLLEAVLHRALADTSHQSSNQRVDEAVSQV
jgi:hypothetical protein